MLTFERSYVARVLALTNQNVTVAAKMLGVSRQYLHSIIARSGVREASDDEPGPE
jgi:transcriptional regulator with GAF, ATPase, and Fis domain